MTYFIHNNRLRYYDDSLIFGFENFLYDADPQISTNRIKATGIQHMLIDLNAATIDKDPRRALTERYEHLLLTLRSPDAHLIATDSTCLRVAVDEYKNGELQDEREFLNIAGVNYISYTDGKILYPQQKRALCAEYIMQNIAKRNIEEQYPYLRSYAEAMSQAKTQADLERIFLPILQNQSWFALAEIK